MPISLYLRTSISLQRRTFASTAIALAKKKKGGKESKESTTTSDVPLDELDPSKLLNELTNSCTNTVSTFEQKLTTLKMGRSNPDIFDKLKVKLDTHEASFPEVALTSVKTPTFLTVTVFDPNHTKRIISSILGSGLNLNPEVDPANNQLLKIKIPNTTKEMKEKTMKEMKQYLDLFRSNASQKDSLVSNRAKSMKEIKNLEGSKDVIKKLTNDVDSVYKKFSDKMNEIFKTAEKQLK